MPYYNVSPFDEIDRLRVYRKGVAGNQSILLFADLSLTFERTVGSNSKDILEIANLRDRSAFAYHPVAGHLPVITAEDLAYP